jgi:hypothetical protein
MVMRELSELLRQLEAIRFYGSLEVKFEAGIITLIRKSETFKPTEPNYGSNRSVSHERNHSR